MPYTFPAPVLVADIGGIVFLPFGLASIMFWIWMLVDCANHEKDSGTKIAWLLIILFLGIIGAPLYFFTRRLPRQRLAHDQAPNGLIRPWRR